MATPQNAPKTNAPKTETKPTAAKPTAETVKTETKKKAGRVNFAVGTELLKVAVPEGYNFDVNKPLKKKNFVTEDLFYMYRAAEMEHKAAQFRAKAEEAKKLGTGTEKNKAKKLIKMQERIEELKQSLAAQGIDVEKLLAELAAKNAAEAAEAKAA